MCESVLTVPWVLGSWLCSLVVFCGLGLQVRRGFGLGTVTAADVLDAFWVGWAAAIAILQVWHLALPVDARAPAVITALGLLGWAGERAALRPLLARAWERKGPVAAWLALGALLAAAALGPIRHYDTGLYLLPTLGWIEAHPIVPGLGNLHGRLAYNSAFLLYAALFDAGPWAGTSHHLANGLLIFALLAQVVAGAWRCLRRRRAARTHDFFGFLLAGPVVALVLGGTLPSLSTDLPAAALSFVIAWRFLRLLTSEGRERRFELFALALLAAAGMAVKLSLAVFAALAPVIAVAVTAVKARRERDGHFGLAGTVLPMAAGAAAILGPWAVRCVLLTGYAVFPGGLIAFPVAWRIPRGMVLDESNWIYSRARSTTAHWGDTLGSWDWLDVWLRDLPPSVTQPVLVLALALGAGIVRRLRRGALAVPRRAWLFLVPPILALGGWFLTAPAPRFAAPLVTVLAAGATCLIFPAGARHAAAIGGIFALVIVLPAIRSPGEEADDGPYCEFPRIAYRTRTAESGLVTYAPPGEDIQCWEAPRPCSPYFKPQLRLRASADLGRGFYLTQRRFQLAYHEDTRLPPGFRLSPDLGVNLGSGWRPRGNGADLPTVTNVGKLFVYAERATTARLRAEVRRITRNRDAVASGRLRVVLAGQPVLAREIRGGDLVELELALRRGFNAVFLEVAAEDPQMRPPDDLAGLTWVRVVFAEVEITGG
ncbi:MAG TPA: hypothetical protein VGG06_05345 [Thermoanaerobaculia bacterium]|jgi:hypothetical protein